MVHGAGTIAAAGLVEGVESRLGGLPLSQRGAGVKR